MSARSSVKPGRLKSRRFVCIHAISSQRAACQNVIALFKRFKIIADRYRNRRRRFGLRFFLIAAIYKMELQVL
jgi:hypothetical protein